MGTGDYFNRPFLEMNEAERAEKRRIILRTIENKENAKPTNPSLIHVIDAEIKRLLAELDNLEKGLM